VEGDPLPPTDPTRRSPKKMPAASDEILIGRQPKEFRRIILFRLNLNPHGSCSIVRSTGRPRSVSDGSPPASHTISPLTIIVVTISPCTAPCQSVSLATQSNRMRSLVGNPFASSAGIPSFAITCRQCVREISGRPP
jgi:hypothetical protein